VAHLEYLRAPKGAAAARLRTTALETAALSHAENYQKNFQENINFY
jgi:hypothetical protein